MIRGFLYYNVDLLLESTDFIILFVLIVCVLGIICLKKNVSIGQGLLKDSDQ